MRWSILVGCVVALTPTTRAQGTVQARDPRRPPPLERSDLCEVWEGTISGNDPTAQASMQVCRVNGPRVSGVFLWSSLQSGWDRRAFEGEWSADGLTLTLRDTRMIESHPMNGWMLCTADRYILRRTVPSRLDGTYDSAGCNDSGTLSLALTGARELPTQPPAEGASPPPSRPASRGRSGCGCAVPLHERRGTGLWIAALSLGVMALSRRASRPR